MHVHEAGNTAEDNDDDVALADNEKGFIEVSSRRLTFDLVAGALSDRRLDSVVDHANRARAQSNSSSPSAQTNNPLNMNSKQRIIVPVRADLVERRLKIWEGLLGPGSRNTGLTAPAVVPQNKPTPNRDIRSQV